MIEVALHNVKEVIVRETWCLDSNCYTTKLTIITEKDKLSVLFFSKSKQIIDSIVNGSFTKVKD